METNCPQLITASVMAAHFNVPLSRIRYILNERPHIRPQARVGAIPVFDAEGMAQVRHELNAMDAKRAGRGNGQ